MNIEIKLKDVLQSIGKELGSSLDPTTTSLSRESNTKIHEFVFSDMKLSVLHTFGSCKTNISAFVKHFEKELNENDVKEIYLCFDNIEDRSYLLFCAKDTSATHKIDTIMNSLCFSEQNSHRFYLLDTGILIILDYSSDHNAFTDNFSEIKNIILVAPTVYENLQTINNPESHKLLKSNIFKKTRTLTSQIYSLDDKKHYYDEDED